jgi:glycosyltransferase involved in cell wall biosynthesis
MKLLMLSPCFFPAIGGVETHVLRVCQELTARGHQVCVVAPRRDAAWAQREKVGEIEVVRVPPKGARIVTLGLVARMAKQADAIHCHDAYSFFRYCLAARALHPSVPVFMTFHGYEAWPIPREAKILRRIAARLCRGKICVGAFIERYYGTACDAVCYGAADIPTESLPAPARLTSGGPASRTAIPQPYGPGRRPDKSGSAIFMGRLARDTGATEFLEAVRLLAQRRNVDLELTIYGRGPLEAEMRDFAEANRLRVSFMGATADPASALAEGEFVFATGYLTILQAMALPRLVFAVYDNPLKRDYLLMFPASPHMVICSDPSQLAEELAFHIENPPARQPMLDCASRFARAQTWDRVAQIYLDLYASRGVRA